MTKKKVQKPVARTMADASLEKEEKNIFVTSRGVAVRGMPIAAMIEAQEQYMRDSLDWPELPVYTYRDVSGEIITVEYSEKMVESEYAPEGAKEKWQAYQVALLDAQNELAAKLGMARSKLLATRGIEIVDKTLEEKWTQDHTWMGATIPTDYNERAFYFFRTEIIGTVEDDMIGIMRAVYCASGYSQEVLDQAEKFFRDSMGEKANTPVNDSGNTQPKVGD